MKAKPYKWDGTAYEPCAVGEVTHVFINLPGPTGMLRLPVITKGTREGTGCWTWNGDTERPTFKPSILTTTGHFAQGFNPEKDSCWCKYNNDHPDEKHSFHCWKCHTFINDGMVQFLGDCTHELANKTVELLEVDL